MHSDKIKLRSFLTTLYFSGDVGVRHHSKRMNTKQNLLKVLLGGASFLILGAFLYLMWPNIEILFPGKTTQISSFNDHVFLVIANGLLTFYFVIDALLEVKPMPRKMLWLVLLPKYQ